MARLSRARRSAIGRAVRAYHRTVRAIVKISPGTRYRDAQATYRAIKTQRAVRRPTAAYVRAHPRIVRALHRARRPEPATTPARRERAERVAEIEPTDRAAYRAAPFSPDNEIEDLDDLDELIDYFDGLDDFDDYQDVEIEANADYEEAK